MEPIIREHVEAGSQLMTDDFQTGWWTPVDFEHQAINHLESYVEGNCHYSIPKSPFCALRSSSRNSRPIRGHSSAVTRIRCHLSPPCSHAE